MKHSYVNHAIIHAKDVNLMITLVLFVIFHGIEICLKISVYVLMVILRVEFKFVQNAIFLVLLVQVKINVYPAKLMTLES